MDHDDTHMRDLEALLASRSANQLVDLLIELSTQIPRAARIIRLRTMPDDERVELDVDEVRKRADLAIRPTWGPFGHPELRASVDVERNVRELVEEGDDYMRAGYSNAAREVYRIVRDAIEDNADALDPHVEWHQTLRSELDELCWSLEPEEQG
jgi:hypothetical protein